MINKNKDFDIIKFLLMVITFMMVVLAINIFFVTENVFVAKADYIGGGEDQAHEEESSDSFYIYIINKSMSMLELNYKEKNKQKSNGIVEYFVENTISFDYKNPKSFLKAQIAMLNDLDGDINKVSEDESILGPDQDSRLYVPEEFNPQDNTNNSEQKSNKPIDEKINNNEDDLTVLNPNMNNSGLDESEGESPNLVEEKNDEIEIVSTLPPTPKKINHNTNEPLVFIYHTHGTESYKPETVGNYHSLKREFTVFRVGEELKSNLENRGYRIIHDETLHDYPSYAGSYSRSLNTLSKNLEKNPSLKVVFDVHRDAIEKVDNLEKEQYDQVRKKSYTIINGEKVARFSLVIGGGNENVESLKRFAYYIKAISDELYPGLAYKVYIKKYQYNQYTSDYSALFEIGNNTNSIDEAVRTSKYLSEVLDHAFRRFINN